MGWGNIYLSTTDMDSCSSTRMSPVLSKKAKDGFVRKFSCLRKVSLHFHLHRVLFFFFTLVCHSLSVIFSFSLSLAFCLPLSFPLQILSSFFNPAQDFHLSDSNLTDPRRKRSHFSERIRATSRITDHL